MLGSKNQIWLVGVLLWAATGQAQAGALTMQGDQRNTSSATDAAQIAAAPSPSKLALVRRFLRLNGTQAEIDSGSFLDRYGIPGGPLTSELPSNGDMVTVRDLLMAPVEALRRAYLPRRAIFQEAYESHVSWEFTEEELNEIVCFLETPAGRHFLAGRWRMEAYVGSNMEGEVEEIVKEAQLDLETRRQVRPR